MWDTIEHLWSEAVVRARRLPEPALYERVDEEWSFVETLRHLVFATDAWASRTVLDDPMPYHPLGYTHSAYPPADAAAIGIDLDARPAFDEVMEVRSARMAVVRRIVDGLTDDELERLCGRSPAPGYPDEQRPVGKCVRVVMVEECEHYRYAVRDLAVLEARHETSGRVPGMDETEKRTARQISESEGLEDWRVLLRSLQASFRTGSMAKGVEFAARIGAAADEANHHPDLTITYPRVHVLLTTHDANGLTTRDVELARADLRDRCRARRSPPSRPPSPNSRSRSTRSTSPP